MYTRAIATGNEHPQQLFAKIELLATKQIHVPGVTCTCINTGKCIKEVKLMKTIFNHDQYERHVCSFLIADEYFAKFCQNWPIRY